MAINRFIIETHTQEWYNFRTVGIKEYAGGIGASEIGIILGINPYQPTLMELYHHKVGTEIPGRNLNEYMFHGLGLEDYVAQLWQYWDGSSDGYMSNYINGVKKRTMHRYNGYVVNDKYPWLFASLDRVMRSKQVKLIRGEITDRECPIECKNLSHYQSRLWIEGIPPYYIAQVNQQMLVTDTTYCEIAVLKDGRKFDVIPVERSAKICKQIIERSYEFWQTILTARKAFKERRLAERAGKYDEARLQEATIQRLEPLPDDNEGYKEYFSEQFLKEVNSMEGTEDDFLRIKSVLAINGIMKGLTKIKRLHANMITNTMVKSGVEKLTFGKSGFITFKKRAGAKKFGLYNNVGPKPSDEFIKNQLQKLNINGNYF